MTSLNSEEYADILKIEKNIATISFCINEDVSIDKLIIVNDGSLINEDIIFLYPINSNHFYKVIRNSTTPKYVKIFNEQSN